MSINTLTEESLLRSKDYRAKRARDIERDLERNGKMGKAPETAIATAAEKQPPDAKNALSMLIKYIPTESVTLYIAAISASAALLTLGITAKMVYWFFGALTPILLLVIFFGKRRAAKLPPIPPVKEWPWWETVAATIAFLVWALAVPNNPYINGQTQGAIAGFFAIFVSTILSVFENLFKRPAEA